MGKIMIIMAALLLGACANNTSNLVDQSSEGEEAKYEVRLHLTSTKAYCGGAKPPQELLDELNTPKPMDSTPVFLRKGTTNNIEQPIDYAMTSNEDGWAKAQLPAGQFSVVFADKKDQQTYDSLFNKYKSSSRMYKAIDTTCLQSYFRKPEKVIVVEKKGANTFEVKDRIHCSRSVPCATYTGPVPPAAPNKK